MTGAAAATGSRLIRFDPRSTRRPVSGPWTRFSRSTPGSTEPGSDVCRIAWAPRAPASARSDIVDRRCRAFDIPQRELFVILGENGQPVSIGPKGQAMRAARRPARNRGLRPHEAPETSWPGHGAWIAARRSGSSPRSLESVSRPWLRRLGTSDFSISSTVRNQSFPSSR